MKTILSLLVISLLFSACKKEQFETYIVEVSADITGVQPLTLNRHQGNAPQIILTDPFETTVTVYDDEPLHLTAAYTDPSVNNKPITITVFSKDWTELKTETAGGSVDLVLQR